MIDQPSKIPVNKPDHPSLEDEFAEIRPDWLRDHLWLGLVIASFVVLVAFVNPLREMAFDDDWIYARTVRHLLETGKYQLDSGSQANMPVQAYWGALFAKVGGYSFSALRLSTLVLMALGLLAFYALLREQHLSDQEAALGTLVLLANPLVIRNSFSFMTDIPFLTWLVIALWLYVRGFNRRNHGLVALASLAGVAAIGTRQFAMALVAGLLIAWALDRERQRSLTLYAVGLALPLLAALWQLWIGFVQPHSGMTYMVNRQSAYLGDLPGLLVQAFLRPTAAMQYLGLFLLPLMPSLVLAVAFFRRRLNETASHANQAAQQLGHSRRQWALLVAWTAYIIAGVVYGYASHRLLMPSLPWTLSQLLRGFAVTVPLTLLTAGSAIFLGWALSSRAIQLNALRTANPVTLFMAGTALTLAGMFLLYELFGDRYLIVFVPFAVVGLAPFMRSWTPWLNFLALVLCLLMLAASAFWMRGVQEQHAALWRGAEALRADGIQPGQISAPWNWNGYHGAYDDYLLAVQRGEIEDSLSWWEWLPQQQSQATYRVTSSLNFPPSENWQVLEEIPYQSIRLRTAWVYVVQRSPE